MRELSLARTEARQSLQKAEELVTHAKSEINALRQSQIGVELRLQELDTIKRIGWGVITLMFSTFIWLAYTTVKNDEQVEEIQQSIRGHMSAEGHVQSMHAISDVAREVHGMSSALDEWKKAKEKEIEDLQNTRRRR